MPEALVTIKRKCYVRHETWREDISRPTLLISRTFISTKHQPSPALHITFETLLTPPSPKLPDSPSSPILYLLTMTWPAVIIINCTFIPLYLILCILNIFNIVKHGARKTTGFLSLLLFSLTHLTGNLILVIEYNLHHSSINTTIWGYILQSIGLSFLVSASLALFTRAKTSLTHNEAGKKRRDRINKFLNSINLAALICFIVGYTSVSFTDKQGNVVNPTLPVETKVGAGLYVALIVGIFTMTVVGLKSVKGDSEEEKIKGVLCIGLPMMAVRAGYAVYTVESGTVLQAKNVWIKLVCQYVMEFGAVCVFTGLGLWLEKVQKEERVDEEESVGTGSGSPMKERWSGSGMRKGEVREVPITYVGSFQRQ